MRSLQLTPKEWKALKPADREMVKKMGFKAPKAQRKRVKKETLPTVPKDYILRKVLTCSCCKTVTRETYYMKYIAEESKSSWDDCLRAIPFNGIQPPDKIERTTIRNCKCCMAALDKLPRKQLIGRIIHLNRIINYGG